MKARRGWSKMADKEPRLALPPATKIWPRDNAAPVRIQSASGSHVLPPLILLVAKGSKPANKELKLVLLPATEIGLRDNA